MGFKILSARQDGISLLSSYFFYSAHPLPPPCCGSHPVWSPPPILTSAFTHPPSLLVVTLPLYLPIEIFLEVSPTPSVEFNGPLQPLQYCVCATNIAFVCVYLMSGLHLWLPSSLGCSLFGRTVLLSCFHPLLAVHCFVSNKCSTHICGTWEAEPVMLKRREP